jgi:tripeptide aminopeptidase
VRPASEAERRRLHDLFADLCRIESPSGRERACADRVAAELRGMGLDVAEDGAGTALGGDAGNLLARIAGPSTAPTVLLCAHLDTVPVVAPVDPIVVDGGWENANDAILGADNKAAVAVMLEAARRLSVEGARVGVELLMTVGEEVGLAGAKEVDRSALRADFGYVYDHASPIGEIVVASPTFFRFGAEFHGQAAHAGIRPEDGHSAVLAAARAVASMPLGRLDEQTTANVSRIVGGGETTNVVPDRARLDGECRSLDSDRAERLVGELIDRIHDAANETSCDVDTTVERLFEAFRIKPEAPAVQAAERALGARGHDVRHIVTGGGSDANVFVLAGLPCVNLANGTERNHQPDERVSRWALEEMLDVTFALLDEAARC